MEENDVNNCEYYFFFFLREYNKKIHGRNEDGVNFKGITIYERGKNNVLCLLKEALIGCESVIPMKEHSIDPFPFSWLHINKG